MKKLVLIMGLVVLIVLNLQITGFAKIVIDTSNVNKGIVTVETTTSITKKTKVRVVKGTSKVDYDFTKENEPVPFALTFGNGKYDVMVYENITDNKYSLKTSESFKVNLTDEDKVYLNSTGEVNWSEDQKYIKLAKELTKDLTTDDEKVKAIYDYLTNNFTYDYTKIYRVSSSYKPDIEKLYDEKTGICYDYSAIFAGMLRSIGIPTKLVKGYSVTNLSTYHAWNSVLVNGEWKMVDTTNDAYKVQNGINVNMYKADNEFNVVNVY